MKRKTKQKRKTKKKNQSRPPFHGDEFESLICKRELVLVRVEQQREPAIRAVPWLIMDKGGVVGLIDGCGGCCWLRLVVSPVRVLQPNARVSALIDHQNGAWNTELVRQIFLQHEADSILAIPLGPPFPRDSRVWAYTASGRFSVECFQLKLEAESLALVAVIAWCLWSSQIQVRLGGERQSAWLTFQRAQTDLEEFQLANHLPTQPRFVSELLWSPPKPPWFKINVDGAVFSSLKTVGVGIVVRDQRGNVAAAMSKLVNAPLGPLETEAKAVEEAI
ncbi:hypothetical protein SO802_020752 [Lithocarpus litseifolius]|uniref:RNase H type-1 domain-containing protein n=1 Tax=Lithocarpus litseifolius TaxID=425828 RepID=A0AAW2CCZ8_9ROSI